MKAATSRASHRKPEAEPASSRQAERDTMMQNNETRIVMRFLEALQSQER